MLTTEWAAADEAQLDGDGAGATACAAEQGSVGVHVALAESRQIAASEGSAVGGKRHWRCKKHRGCDRTNPR